MKRATAALEKGLAEEALDLLLDAWREKRSPQLADAIDALAHAFPAPQLDEDDAHAAWMDLAREGRAADVDGLLATLVAAGPIGVLAGRVEQLVDRPADPRIALAFAKLALEPPTTSSSNFPIWTKIFALLEHSADARIAPLLKTRLAMKKGPSKFWPKLYNGLERILKKLPAAPALTKDEAAAITAITAVARAAKSAKPVKAASKAEVATTKTAKKKTKAVAGDPLARAVSAAEARDLPACVDALLDAWREKRLVAYSEAIDRVTAIHDEGRAPPGGTSTELQKTWLALAAEERAIDVGRLADAAGDGRRADVDARFEAMLAWPEDPRIGRAMLLASLNNTYSDRARTWMLVGDLLARNADARFRDSLEDLAKARGQNKARRSTLRRVAPVALARLADVPDAPSAERRRDSRAREGPRRARQDPDAGTPLPRRHPRLCRRPAVARRASRA